MRCLLLIVFAALVALPAAAQEPLLPPLAPLTVESAPSVAPLVRLGRGVVRDVQWSPDGAALAVATTLGVWLQPADATSEARLIEGQLGASAIAFRPDGGTLAVGGDDGSLLLAAAGPADELVRAERHIYAVVAVGYSADGARLASADVSGVVRVWNADTLEELAVFQGSGMPLAVALNGDGSALAVSTRAAVDVWRLDAGETPVAHWPLPPETPLRVPLVFVGPDSVVFAHDTRLYRAAIRQDVIRQQDVGATVLDLRRDDLGVVVVSHGERLFEAWTLDGEARLAQLDDADRSASFARFSPDWQRVASIGSAGPRLRLWTLAGRDRAEWLVGYTGPLVGVTYEGRALAAVDDAGTVTLWNPTTGARVATFDTWSSGQPGAALAASPDGRWLATGGDDSVVHLIDAATGQEVAPLHGHIRSVTTLAFNADSTLLATGSLDGAIHLWDVTTGQLLARLSGHTAGVSGLAFSAANDLLASVSHDGTVRLWGVPQG